MLGGHPFFWQNPILKHKNDDHEGRTRSPSARPPGDDEPIIDDPGNVQSERMNVDKIDLSKESKPPTQAEARVQKLTRKWDPDAQSDSDSSDEFQVAVESPLPMSDVEEYPEPEDQGQVRQPEGNQVSDDDDDDHMDVELTNDPGNVAEDPPGDPEGPPDKETSPPPKFAGCVRVERNNWDPWRDTGTGGQQDAGTHEESQTMHTQDSESESQSDMTEEDEGKDEGKLEPNVSNEEALRDSGSHLPSADQPDRTPDPEGRPNDRKSETGPTVIRSSFANHKEDNSLEITLDDEGVWDRQMTRRRGPNNVYERPVEVMISSDDDTDELSDHGHDLEEGFKEIQHPEFKPFGMRYLPLPTYAATGMLSALDIFPFANDQSKREHYFQAYGITLATENRQGQVVYFHGDAEIRITEPQPGLRIEVPGRQRTNEMRERLFRMNDFAEINRYQPRPATPPRRRNADAIRPNHMSKEEIATLIHELKTHPWIGKEYSRVYSFERKSDGTILVRRGWPSEWSTDTASDTESEEDSLFSTDSDNDEPTDDAREQVKETPTRLGKDPPTSDQAPAASKGKARNEDRASHMDAPQNMETMKNNETNLVEQPLFASKPEPGGPQETQHRELFASASYNQENSENDEQDIKADEETHQVPTHETSSPAKQTATTSSQANGQSCCKCCNCPGVNQTTPQPVSVEPPQESRPLEETVQDPPGLDNVPPEDAAMHQDLPNHGVVVSGLLTARHLVELEDPDGCPHHRSFLAYGATIAGGDRDHSPYVHQGHAVIHLYNSNFAEDNEFPPPPYRDRVLASRLRRMYDGIEAHPDEILNIARMPLPLPPASFARLPSDADPTVWMKPIRVTVSDEFGRTITLDEACRRLRELEDQMDASLEELKQTVKRETAAAKDSKPVQSVSVYEDYNDSHLAFNGPPGTPPIRVYRMTTLDDTPTIEEEDLKFKIPLAPQTLSSKDTPIVPDYEGTLVPDEAPFRYYPDDIIPDFEDCVLIEHEADQTLTPEGFAAWKKRLEGENRLPPADAVSEALKRVQGNVANLGPEIDRLHEEEGKTLTQCIAGLGLLQIVHDMYKARDGGEELDPEFWIARIATALKEKEDEEIRFYSKKLFAPSNANAAEAPKDEVMKDDCAPEVSNDATKSNQATHEVKEEPIPVPIPSTPVDWYPDVTIAPTSNAAEDEEPFYVPQSPIPFELNELKDRVWELEGKIDTVRTECNEKIREMDCQMYADKCLLAELKWKTADLAESEDRAYEDTKQEWRKHSPNAQSAHRYRTRYTTNFANKKDAETRRALLGLSQRIRTVEEKAERTREDVEKLKGKVKGIPDLGPKIDELRKLVEDERKALNDTRDIFTSEINALKDSPGIKELLNSHTSEIANLNQRYLYLYNLAFNYYNTAQASSSTVPYRDLVPAPKFSPIKSDRQPVLSF